MSSSQRLGTGEEVVITRHGKPVARLAPARVQRTPEERAALLRSLIAKRDAMAAEHPETAAPDESEWRRIPDIARRERLGAYDAAYLELALRTGAAVASRDASLIAAALARGVRVHDLR